MIDEFHLAALGKSCDTSERLLPIQSSQECEMAQKFLQKNDPYFKESKFVVASGNGSDLPYGCISDKVSGNHYVYTNTDGNGQTVSADENLRSICAKRSDGNHKSIDFRHYISMFLYMIIIVILFVFHVIFE